MRSMAMNHTFSCCEINYVCKQEIYKFELNSEKITILLQVPSRGKFAESHALLVNTVKCFDGIFHKKSKAL